MVGIKACGAYIPFFRLKREDIAKALGGGAGRGEKAVANFDEDSVTMAVAAALDCLQGIEPSTVDALYFASTTMPYKEKQCAAIVASVLGLRRDAFTSDFSSSLRAGTIAIKTACDAVKSGSAKNVLVVASDSRLGGAGTPFELTFGDGAAAFLIGDTDLLATLEAEYTHTNEFIDIWRTKDDEFVRSWEDRFIFDKGYQNNILEGVGNFVKDQGINLQEVDKVVLSAPDARRIQGAIKAMKLDIKSQVQNPLFDQVGNTGAAFAPMMLVAALEDAKKGNKILVANYGDGCDVLLFNVNEPLGDIEGRRGTKGYLNSKAYMANYEKYLRFRKILSLEAERTRPPQSSFAPVLWRDQKWVLGLNASKCNECGRLFFPPQRICAYCQSKDKFEYVKLSGRKGTLFTFNLDFLARSDDSPEVFTRVHLGDVGIYCRMTDRIPEQIDIDMPVEMTFRKFHEGAGYPNYFWKCMPTREVRT
ncbi:MAG: 3-oxoacyl-[acyl-carrier-protein] synthase III C-terminal domain-containing protein [Thermodesulfobacteriota bacterium]|nr:3-oxoacyl-[acyl-carrier-protein] synthase III C-terminal domain-containing protein [Thermodesulfobacteriota bacterium]